MTVYRRNISIYHFILIACLVSFSLLCTACVQPTGYQPKTHLLQRLSREDAAERIRLVLLRASNPQIDEVTVTEEFLNYQIHPTPIVVPGPLPTAPFLFTSRMYQTPVVIRLFLGKVEGVEVFDNHAAFVRGPGGQFIAQFFFPTAEDAKIFADLLMSLREMYRAQPRS